jgi:hypothetical protein
MVKNIVKPIFVILSILTLMSLSFVSAQSFPYQNTSSPYWHDTPIIDGRHIYGYVHPPYEHIPLVSGTSPTPEGHNNNFLLPYPTPAPTQTPSPVPIKFSGSISNIPAYPVPTAA